MGGDGLGKAAVGDMAQKGCALPAPQLGGFLKLEL